MHAYVPLRLLFFCNCLYDTHTNTTVCQNQSRTSAGNELPLAAHTAISIKHEDKTFHKPSRQPSVISCDYTDIDSEVSGAYHNVPASLERISLTPGIRLLPSSAYACGRSLVLANSYAHDSNESVEIRATPRGRHKDTTTILKDGQVYSIIDPGSNSNADHIYTTCSQPIPSEPADRVAKIHHETVIKNLESETEDISLPHLCRQNIKERTPTLQPLSQNSGHEFEPVVEDAGSPSLVATSQHPIFDGNPLPLYQSLVLQTKDYEHMYSNPETTSLDSQSMNSVEYHYI